ncbi:MAG: DUF739 family protein [Clostridia bacterium]|nr:DUF739 family protein [Clostridia bacterium]
MIFTEKIDYSKLRGRIIEKCGTIGAFAKKIDRSPGCISRKLAGNNTWDQEEIMICCEVLGISLTDMHQYFFTLKVQ